MVLQLLQRQRQSLYHDLHCHLFPVELLLDFEKHDGDCFKGASCPLISFRVWFHWLLGSQSIQIRADASRLQALNIFLFRPHLMFLEDLIRKWGNTGCSLIPSGTSEPAWSCLRSCLLVCIPQPFLRFASATHFRAVCNNQVDWNFCHCCLGRVEGQWTQRCSWPQILQGQHMCVFQAPSLASVCSAHGPFSRSYNIWPTHVVFFPLLYCSSCTALARLKCRLFQILYSP